MPMSPIQLSDRDVRLVLDAAGSCHEAVVDPVPEVQNVLDAVSRLVRCDVIFWNAFELRPAIKELSLTSGREGREVARMPLEPWLRHRHEHPIMSGRYGPVVAISDVLTAREFRRMWLWSDVFRPEGLRHEVGVHLAHRPDAIDVVVLSRGPGRDFSHRDRDVLRLMRPHVERAIRRITTPAPRVTARQHEILALVSGGLSNRQIARRLGVAEATVGKHLEHIYSRTGVTNRLQAAALIAADNDLPPRSPRTEKSVWGGRPAAT
jgi:DNA-binding CsgD family transcriptional regulator